MWTLENATERRKESWEEFYLPSKNELLSLHIWSIVKLIFIYEEWKNERMWVEIKNIFSNGEFEGILINTPSNIPDLYYEDKIIFWCNNIIDIYQK